MTPKASRRVNEENVERMLESYFRATRPAVDDEGKAGLPTRSHRLAAPSESQATFARAARKRPCVRSPRSPSSRPKRASWDRAPGRCNLPSRASSRSRTRSGEPTLATGSLICLCRLPPSPPAAFPTWFRRACGMIELERSCRHSAREVATARCVVLAFSNALTPLPASR